jgi:membrane-associated protease RseP (regulator of RpoE activity)
MGSFANLVVFVAAGLLFLGLIYFVGMEFKPNGMKVVGFMEGYPAKDVLPSSTVIEEINGHSVRDYRSFRNVSAGVKPGDTVLLSTSGGVFKLTAAENPEDKSKGYLGVLIIQNVVYVGPIWKVFISELLQWIAFFNINIALVNLLPAVPFDGGRMFKEFISTLRISGAYINRVLYAVLAFTAVLFVVNLIPLLKMVLSFFLKLV